MTTDALFDRVDDVLAGMPAGAILTVYTEEPAAASAAPSWCASHDAEPTKPPTDPRLPPKT